MGRYFYILIYLDQQDSWDQDDEEQEEEEDAGTKSPTPKESGPGKKNLKKLGEKFEEKEAGFLEMEQSNTTQERNEGDTN